MSWRILWPEERIVNSSWIARQYDDAKANGQLDDNDRDHKNIDDMAKSLSRAGLITLGEKKMSKLADILQMIKSRADQGGRRMESAMAACDEIEKLADEAIELEARERRTALRNITGQN